MQFHPTVLYIAGSARHLLTEALRGEGAYLRDRNGHRFMPDYHPLAELAPRDDVSRAITAQMARTQHPSVYLDLSHLDAAYIRQPVPRHRPALPRLRPRHHPRPDPGPPRCPLHDRRRDRRPRRPDDAARPLGRGRGHQLGPPRRQPAGLEQPARRARLRRPRRRGHRSEPSRGRRPAPPRSPADRGRGRRRRPRAARPGRHPRLAPRPDVALGRHHPRRRTAWPRPPSRSTSGAATSSARSSPTPPAGPCRTCSPSPD